MGLQAVWNAGTGLRTEPFTTWHSVLWSKSAGPEAATGRAIGLMGGRLRLEAYTLTFIDGFHLLAWTCVMALVLIALLRRSPLDYGDLSTFQQQPLERREPS